MGSKWSEGLLVLDNWTFFLPQRCTPLAVACTHALSTSSEHDLVSALPAPPLVVLAADPWPPPRLDSNLSSTSPS